jgi:hypothetical protein
MIRLQDSQRKAVAKVVESRTPDEVFVFGSVYVQSTPEKYLKLASDNAPDHAVGFWGVYGVRPLTKNTTLDAYCLGLDRKTAAFNRGVGHEVRHSIGARLSRPIAERNPGWDFDYEALWQFGSFGSANISAWTVASETGCRFPNIPLKPRFSAKADISSGDDPRKNTLGTGPINFIDAHPRVEATLPQGV